MRCLFLLTFLISGALAAPSNFQSFQNLLDKHLTDRKISSGFETFFDYQKAKTDPSALKEISKQAEILKNFDTTQLKTKSEALAFWINCYNFFMIKRILDKGFKKNKLNIESFKDLGSFINPYSGFDKKFANIGGVLMSLDDIEKGWLLGQKGQYKKKYSQKNWKDARVHFAVNCASVGCPIIQKKVYLASTIESQLSRVVTEAFKTQRHFHLKKDILRVTALFKWYWKDFKEYSGSVLKFIANFVEGTELKTQVLNTKKIDYIEYNWNLNIRENFEKSNANRDWTNSE